MAAVPPPAAMTAPQAQAAVFRDMLRTVIPPIHSAGLTDVDYLA
jgi:hypothetical protein